MKVLQVLGGGKWAGTSVVVMAITKALLARGDEVWVICLDEEVAGRFRAAGARTLRCPLWFRPINPLDAVPLAQLTALCRRQRFDLVVTHTSKGGVLGRVAAWAANVPAIVHHAHGYSFNGPQSPGIRRWYVALERLASRAGHLTIAVAEEHRRAAIESRIERPETIRTIHNGIDLTPFAEADREAGRRRFGFRDDELVIGVTSRLAPLKGLEFLIAAMPEVVSRFPTARAVIAGDGPLEAALRRQARAAGVEAAVLFPGFVREVPSFLAACDVFTLPSLREGLSVSVVEAMAAGLPVVGTDIPGTREQIRHGVTGLLAPGGDRAALAGALVRLLADADLRARLGANARREAQARFSESMMVARHLAVYDELCHPPQLPVSRWLLQPRAFRGSH
jgi:glycosyltransferase involved in cell wall biosynthesis